MQNRTDLVGISYAERLKQLLTGNSGPLQLLLCAVSGYIMSNAFVFGSVSPFATAFCSALSGRYAICAAAGSVLGYTFTANPLANIAYIAAVILVIAVKLLFGIKSSGKYRIFLSAATALACSGISRGALLLLSNATLYDVMLAFAEMLLCGGSAYFFARTADALQTGLPAMRKSDLSCMVVSFAVVLLGLSGVSIAGVSTGRILAALCVLLCARYSGESGGAVSGITVGATLGLAGGDFSYALAAYGLGGLVSGVFGALGRIATAAAFIILNTIAALLTKQYSDVYIAIAEVFFASVIFVAIPQSWCGKLRVFTPAKTEAAAGLDAQIVIQDRLCDISGALREISTATHKVSEKLGKMTSPAKTDICTQAVEHVCKYCPDKTTCWQQKYSDTQNALSTCINILRREGALLRSQVPVHFVNSCSKIDELLDELSARFHNTVAREGVQRKVSKVRSVVTDQFDGIAMIMDELSGELSAMRLDNEKDSTRVREYFEKEGFSIRQALCFTDTSELCRIEISIPAYQLARLQKVKSALDLGALLEADFDLPQITSRGNFTNLCYFEKATYTVDLGVYQIACGQNRLCGDAYDYIRNQSGRAHFILSDGMGSGGNAAVDSVMASGLITRLISVGIGHEAALKMVNSALLVKSGEESLATIDICSLNLFSGKAEFYKAGAAPTFLLKGNHAGYLESTSLPAGILSGVAFEKSSITLHEGDVVLMVSDGAVTTGTDWIKSDLETAKSVDVQRLCEKIATTAKARRTDGREDDITVMAVALRKSA